MGQVGQLTGMAYRTSCMCNRPVPHTELAPGSRILLRRPSGVARDLEWLRHEHAEIGSLPSLSSIRLLASQISVSSLSFLTSSLPFPLLSLPFSFLPFRIPIPSPLYPSLSFPPKPIPLRFKGVRWYNPGKNVRKCR